MQTWLEIKYGRANSGVATLDSPIATLFIEDEFGKPVSQEVLDALHRDIRGFWADKLADPKARSQLGPSNAIGFQISEEFRILLEGKYPWLRLCEGHWKVTQLWKSNWTSWARNHHIDGPPLPTSDAEGSVGGKRHSTDEEGNPGPLKKHKGKEVERGKPLTPSFHPPRPKAQKIRAKAAKVSNSISILVPYTLANDL